MHLEGLIEDIGGFGLYQKILIPTLACSKIIIVQTMLMMAFAGVEPEWWCTSSDNELSQWNTSQLNGSYQNCVWNGTCERKFSDVMETAVTEWNLVCEMSWVSNAIISVQMAGLLVGAIVAGYCADKYGRKKVFYGGLFVTCLGNIVSAFSVSWIMFSIVRAFLGVGCGLHLATVYLYQIEFVGTKWRAFVASLPDWPLGMLILSLLAKLLHNWKWIHLAVAALTFPYLCTWFFVPESLRWLTVKGRLEEAKSVINKMAAYNKKPVPDTSILELIAEEEKAEGKQTRNYSYLDLLRKKKLFKKTFYSCFIWFGCAVVYYGIAFGLKNLSGDFYMNLTLMALTELPITPCIIFITSFFGRRVGAALSFLLTAALCFGLAISTRLAPADERGNYINACAIAAKFTISTGWLVSMTLCAEQFPTVIRNLSSAAQSAAARIGGIFAGQVLSLGGTKDLMVPFVALGILAVLTVLATIGLEETRGKALEDTMISTSKSARKGCVHTSGDQGTPLVSSSSGDQGTPLVSSSSGDQGTPLVSSSSGSFNNRKDEVDEQTVKN